MEVPKIAVVPKFTEADVSKKGFINKEDLHKLGRNLLIFLIPTILLYAGQLTFALTDHTALTPQDLIPSAQVIGAFEGYIIAAVLDYLKKLNNGKE